MSILYNRLTPIACWDTLRVVESYYSIERGGLVFYNIYLYILIKNKN